MRIISGKYKGRPIKPKKSFKARPTTDNAKEALFNILNNTIDFEGLEVLDLFSGTGSISYEFASRGCKKVFSVEKNFKHVKFINSVVDDLQIDNMTVALGNVFIYIKKTPLKFDIIFADPPFELEEIDTIPYKIFEQDILKPEGIVIIEHSPDTDFSAHPNFKETRKYGKVNFSFFE